MPEPRRAANLPRLRWLNAGHIAALMPTLAEQLALAERALVGLASGAELPAKIGVHPRPEASFGHAMPAHMRGAAQDGADDLVGMKWIVGVPGNRAAALPAMNALVVLNDPLTGVPLAVLDGGPITAVRTAAISGVAMARWTPPAAGPAGRAGQAGQAGQAPRVAVIGAGAQGHSHVPVIGHVLPGAEVAIFDRDPAYAQVLAGIAAETPGIGSATAVASAREAVADADVVVTAISFGPVRQTMTTDWFAADALIIAVDYATSVAADVARGAGLFLVDERVQFEANRSAGQFEGYPDPGALIGEAILANTPRPAKGRVLVTHLGTGLADLVFADAIHRAALARHRGTILPR